MSGRQRSPKRLCEETRALAKHLEIDFDPYDFGWAVPAWKKSRGYPRESWETYEDLPEKWPDGSTPGPQAEFIAWAKTELIQRLHASDPLALPAYIFFEKPIRLLPAKTWLVHFSRERFHSFDRGATIETLALSTHARPMVLKSCRQNLSPNVGFFEIVWAFAYDADLVCRTGFLL